MGGHRVSPTQGDSEVREGCGQRLEMNEGGPWGGCWFGEQPPWKGMNRVPSVTVGFQRERRLGGPKRGLAFTYQGRLAWREESMLRSKLGLWGRDPRGAGWRPVLCVEKGGRW